MRPRRSGRQRACVRHRRHVGKTGTGSSPRSCRTAVGALQGAREPRTQRSEDRASPRRTASMGSAIRLRRTWPTRRTQAFQGLDSTNQEATQSVRDVAGLKCQRCCRLDDDPQAPTTPTPGRRSAHGPARRRRRRSSRPQGASGAGGDPQGANVLPRARGRASRPPTFATRQPPSLCSRPCSAPRSP